MQIIDAHLHFWDLSNKMNSWVSRQENSPFLNKNYLPDTVVGNCSENLVGVIHIEAHDSATPTIAEIKWLDTTMKNNPLKFRHIAFADITLPNPEFCNIIDQIKEYSNVIGIRHILSHHPSFSYSPCDEDLSKDSNIQANLSYLAKNKLIFDCQMYAYQINNILPEIINSGVTCIVDHLALPAWKQENDADHQQWKDTIIKLATLKNIFIKVSGLDMFQVREHFDNVIQYCLDTFPINRLVYGSNYPVSFNHDYNYWYNYLNKLHLSGLEKEQLFYKNALTLFFKD